MLSNLKDITQVIESPSYLLHTSFANNGTCGSGSSDDESIDYTPSPQQQQMVDQSLPNVDLISFRRCMMQRRPSIPRSTSWSYNLNV